MKKSVSVKPSPYNSVKPWLVVLLFLGAILGIFVDKLTTNLFAQIMLLAAFGLTMAVIVMLKINHISNKLKKSGQAFSK